MERPRYNLCSDIEASPWRWTNLAGVLIRYFYGLRLVFGTTRGGRLFASNMLAAFGLTSGVVQFIAQLFPDAIKSPEWVTLGAFLLCLVWGLARAYPRQRISREFDQPDITVSIQTGDIFEQDAHIVVGFTDTFDTSIAGARVISAASLQGQLVERRYGGSQARIDRELRAALSRRSPVATESRRSKPWGKLKRYDIGTVAVIGRPDRLIFATAYSKMGNDLLARSTIDDLWISLSALWEAAYLHAQHSCVAIPLVGSGLARIDLLERQNLIRMILLSFLARSRQSVVCRELRIIIWPDDIGKVDMLEAEAFLRSL